MQRPTNNPEHNIYMNQHGVSRVFLMAMLVFWIAILSIASLNRQNITDYLALRNYAPPAAIAALADDTTMNDYGRKIFFVNKPSLDSKEVFRTSCPNNGGEQSIVLGCYYGNQKGINLLDVTDERLSGVEQVTAAHEMLHGAYDRLNSADRTRIDGLLQDYYDNILSDERVKSTVDAYFKTEPNDVVNEMHSIFATEVIDLPTELETYYQRYFDDRQVVTSFAARYQSEFTSRRDRVAQFDEQLSSIKESIESQEAALEQSQRTIDDQQTALQNRRSSGDIEGYNAGVPGFNASVSAYNADVQTLRATIENYNSLVAERNAITVEESELADALNTNVESINQ